MSGELEACDKAAAELARAYQLLGVVSITVRTVPDSPNVKAICPAIGIPAISEFLHKAANALFNGPAMMRVRH